MLKYIFIFLISFICYKAVAQQRIVTIVPLDIWDSYPVPDDSAVISSYGDDTTSWTLFQKNERIYTINTFEPFAKEQVPNDSIPASVRNKLWKDQKVLYRQGESILAVDDGYLIGMNRGEWGGALFWYSRDGRYSYKISNDQVVEFVKKENRIYAIEGLAHLSLSRGSLIELKKVNSKWKAEKVLTLPYAPFGIALNSKNNFIIGTTDNIIEISETGQYRILYRNPFWHKYGYLYPESTLIQNDILYVGMRKGILKFDLNTYEKVWLMKK